MNAAGRKFDIVTFTDSFGTDAITAITDIDGYLVYVDVSGGGDNDAIRETMVEILEAYN